MSLDTNDICTVILAGGQGRRMQGQDKGLLEWRGKPLIEHVLEALQVDLQGLMISANRNIERYRSYGYPVLHDSIGDYQGPLIGILTAMQHCRRNYLLCIPCDSPEPPPQLVERLSDCMLREDARCAICYDGKRLQPLFSLLSRNLQPQLEQFLADGRRKVHDFFEESYPAICDFSDLQQHFYNFNNPEDMQ
jgi:molybdenum cofactor guanylyltransferase